MLRLGGVMNEIRVAMRVTNGQKMEFSTINSQNIAILWPNVVWDIILLYTSLANVWKH